jgi:ATP-dependent Clp protease protease subunit
MTFPSWPPASFPPMGPGRWGRPPEPAPNRANREWADGLRSRLFEHRTIMLRGELDAEVANVAAAELMTLDATGDSRITVHLDLAGGTLEDAFAVMDVIDLVGVPVHVLCTGRAEGPAVGILAVATRRASAPHARFRLTEANASMSGSATELHRWAEHHIARMQRFHERLAAAVRRPVDEVAADCAEGRYLTAEQALSYRLIDEIASPRGAVYPLPARTVGFRSDFGR